MAEEPRIETDPRELREVARMQLLEERPEVRLEREKVGTVLLRREVETRTETVQVELTREVLVVRNEASGGGPTVEVNGTVLEPGQEVRLEIYQEAPQVGKVVVAREDVRVFKRTVTESQQVGLELGREVLKVETEGEVMLKKG